ncbi:hypothetical protein WJX81_005888 [Elliptochloris bilobata]|uniref:Bromo domain-containing protein n=1 Tax=Elliptochloris bilobata TaxID=381761 RepID=A0AAW1SK70_9CHLO
MADAAPVAAGSGGGPGDGADATSGGLDAADRGGVEGNDAGDGTGGGGVADPAAEERRAARRKRHRAELDAARRWDLRARLADVSADVELLTLEVARLQQAGAAAAPKPREMSESERARLAEMHARRLIDLVPKHCLAVLKGVQSHPFAWPFNTPVDVSKFPDYPTIVTRPMDFKTVAERAEARQYADPAAMQADVRQVFRNCELYNPPGSDIRFLAQGLEDRFEERWAQQVALRLAEAEAAACTEEEAMRHRIAEAEQRKAAEATAEAAARLARHFEGVEARLQDAKALAAACCEPPLTPAEKGALAAALDALPPEQFEWAMGLVLARHPGFAPPPGAPGDLSFELGGLGTVSLRQLQHFVAACARPGGPPAIWPGLPVGAGIKAQRGLQKRPQAASDDTHAEAEAVGAEAQGA